MRGRWWTASCVLSGTLASFPLEFVHAHGREQLQSVLINDVDQSVRLFVLVLAQTRPQRMMKVERTYFSRDSTRKLVKTNDLRRTIGHGGHSNRC